MNLNQGMLIENRYQILDVIGSGGMGTVYRVSDEAAAGEILALKTMKVSRAGGRYTADLERRFREEFRILTQLRHPHLVTVYDYGVTAEETLYYTMEWVAGPTIQPIRSPLLPTETLPVMVQVCRALAYLHARGIVHGDLKPQNVLLTTKDKTNPPHIKLVDFGLAQEMRGGEVRSQYFTLDYASPEVKEGRPIDERADLYSLGALWYALLTGEPPQFMDGPTKQRLVRFMLEAALTDLPGVPMALSEIIARLMAATPDARYASAAAVLEAVDAVTEQKYRLETRETARSYALRTHFVDREVELDTLWSAWSAAQEGAGRFVVLGGEAGAGKSRLLEELETQVEIAGGRVVWGRSVEQGGNAYHPWREVLRVLVRYVDGAPFLHRVGPVLATLLPELWRREFMAGQEPPMELPAEAAQRRLNEAILEVLKAAATRRPTVIVIEDVHWADEATLSLLDLLVEAKGVDHLLTIVTYRDEEIPAHHRLHTWEKTEIVSLKMHRLSPTATTELAQSMLGLESLPAALAARVQRTTGGNVLFVQELLRSLAEEELVLQRTINGWRVNDTALETAALPASIQQVIERRLNRVRDETQKVLQWAAVMGEVFWETAVATIGRVPLAQVRTALAEALDQGLVIVRSDSTLAGEREYRFEHLTVREVSYATLSEDMRQSHHRSSAQWLIDRPKEERDEYLALIGEHYAAAEEPMQAATWYTQAGRRAQNTYALGTAITFYRKALTLLKKATESSETLSLQLQLHENLIEVYKWQARYGESMRSAGAMCASAKRAGDLKAQARAQAQLALSQSYLGDQKLTIEVAQQAAEVARRADAQLELSMALFIMGWAYHETGEFKTALELAHRALSIGERIDDPLMQAQSLNLLGAVLEKLGDYDKAIRVTKSALALFEDLNDLRKVGHMLINLGEKERARGHHLEAVGFYEKALEISRKTRSQDAEMLILSNLGGARVSLGDYQAAESTLQQSIDQAEATGTFWFLWETYCFLAEAQRNQGKIGAATSSAQRALSLAQDEECKEGLGWAWLVLGKVASATGYISVEEQGYGASECFAKSLTIFSNIGMKAEQAHTLRAWAEHELEYGNRERGLKFWQKARTMYEDLELTFELEQMPVQPD